LDWLISLDKPTIAPNGLRRSCAKIEKNLSLVALLSSKNRAFSFNCLSDKLRAYAIDAWKTNVSINLAIQFRKLGRKVVILDVDFGLANIEILFGVVPKYNLSDVINGKMGITDVLTDGPLGIQFISGGSGVQDLMFLSNEQISNLSQSLYYLDKYADIIIIDTGAGINSSVLNFVSIANDVVLVTTPEPTSITDAYALIKTLKHEKQINLNKIKLLVNRTDNIQEGIDVFNKLNYVIKRFLEDEIMMLGTVPFDANLIKAVKKQEPVSICFKSSKSTKAFETIAISLFENGTVDIQKESGINRFINKILKKN